MFPANHKKHGLIWRIFLPKQCLINPSKVTIIPEIKAIVCVCKGQSETLKKQSQMQFQSHKTVSE